MTDKLNPTIVQDIKDREPNHKLIKRLEEMLEDAKSGELRSMLFLNVFDAGDVSNGYVLDDRHRNVRTIRRTILGECMLMQHELMLDIGAVESESTLSGI